MDDRRFDHLSIGLGQATSRREAFRLLGRAIAGSALAAFGVGPAWGATEDENQQCRTACQTMCTSRTSSGRQVLSFDCYRSCVSGCAPVTCGHATTACDDDDIDTATLEAARSALAAGSLDVPLGRTGCTRYRRILAAGGAVAEEGIYLNGKPALQLFHGRLQSLLRIDANLDGCFEWRATATRGATAARDQLQVDDFSKTTGELLERSTYTHKGSTLLHVVDQAPDANGKLVTIAQFDIPLMAGVDETDVKSAAVSTKSDSGCSAQDLASIRERLKGAVDKGLACLDKQGKDDLWLTLVHAYVRDIDIQCETLSDGLIATTDWFKEGFMDRTPRARIRVDPTRFNNLSDSPGNQESTLFHELLHLQLPDHDLDMKNDLPAGDFDNADQVQACTSMCFNFVGAATRCQCARCLGTTKCDPRCMSFKDCNPELAALCNCGQHKWFRTNTECRTECPKGLLCFGFSKCDVIDVSCS